MPRKEIAVIDVDRIEERSPFQFRVSVREGSTATRHDVTVTADMIDRLAKGRRAEDVIEAAFRFLLEREPKESILASFDVSVIQRYFPEFERELPDYLARS